MKILDEDGNDEIDKEELLSNIGSIYDVLLGKKLKALDVIIRGNWDKLVLKDTDYITKHGLAALCEMIITDLGIEMNATFDSDVKDIIHLVDPTKCNKIR